MNTNKIDEKKARFADRDSGNDAPRHSVNAALQRSSTYVYRNDLRQAMREDMQKYLMDIAQEYRNNVGDEKHIENIKAFANEISKNHSSILKNKRFRIGVAQKALNVYLKYLWCQGKIKEPPHCPFDGGIINKLSLGKEFSRAWTQTDEINDYRAWVKVAKEVAKRENLSLAEWELIVWKEG